MESASHRPPAPLALKRDEVRTATSVVWRARDRRRTLQLALATLWLLDAVLQLQPVMFSRGFAQMLAGSARGNPAALGMPITVAAQIVSQHPQLADVAFAVVQLLLAVGIAWRRSVRVALACSIAWALAVWWIGEGLGGVFVGASANNLANGGPGAALLYAVLAVVLWPVGVCTAKPDAGADREQEDFVASGALGAARARLLWVLVWLAVALAAAHSSPAMIAPPRGQPHWLAWLDHRAGVMLARDGTLISGALVALCGVVGLAVFVPAAARRPVLAAALAAITLVWVAAQDLGGILAGGATDPSSGPPLALLVLSYWPRRVANGSQRPVRSQLLRDRNWPVWQAVARR